MNNQMYRRTWTPIQNQSEFTSKSSITIYDSGAYWGELYSDGEWKCWEIISRQQENDGIIEYLREMPQDFVPFEIINTETLPLKIVNPSRQEFEIPGYRILVNLTAQVQ